MPLVVILTLKLYFSVNSSISKSLLCNKGSPLTCKYIVLVYCLIFFKIMSNFCKDNSFFKRLSLEQKEQFKLQILVI